MNVVEKIYILKTFTDIISHKIIQKRGSFNKNFVNFLSLSLLLIAHLQIQALCKMPEFHLIFWCWNFVERYIFPGVSDELLETLLKLCFFTKSTHQEIKAAFTCTYFFNVMLTGGTCFIHSLTLCKFSRVYDAACVFYCVIAFE